MEEKWCDSCHCQNDCEEKEEYLESEDVYCPYYA